ncbi:hypothetical protein EX30DRAFT_396726 [Ascodesmis nigricans]|uniref:Uncharacterized protein n=1 Tax=Ascodesmis nigricans TaxID=341454 RepID=A0A4S2MTW1_9PEZI|nr:hypothetical protein EX30DRAFT_396726 [Ascodesmis nigricans]
MHPLLHLLLISSTALAAPTEVQTSVVSTTNPSNVGSSQLKPFNFPSLFDLSPDHYSSDGMLERAQRSALVRKKKLNPRGPVPESAKDKAVSATDSSAGKNNSVNKDDLASNGEVALIPTVPATVSGKTVDITINLPRQHASNNTEVQVTKAVPKVPKKKGSSKSGEKVDDNKVIQYGGRLWDFSKSAKYYATRRQLELWTPVDNYLLGDRNRQLYVSPSLADGTRRLGLPVYASGWEPATLRFAHCPDWYLGPKYPYPSDLKLGVLTLAQTGGWEGTLYLEPVKSHKKHPLPPFVARIGNLTDPSTRSDPDHLVSRFGFKSDFGPKLGYQTGPYFDQYTTDLEYIWSLCKIPGSETDVELYFGEVGDGTTYCSPGFQLRGLFKMDTW